MRFKVKQRSRFLAAVAAMSIALSSSAQSPAPDAAALSEINNFRQYSSQFASDGQPTSEQYSTLRDAGFERVVYIGFTDNPNAVANADQVVKQLGMDYIHIPVDWANPTKRDYYVFADAMQRDPERKTLLHCQVNARATAFSFLYRVIHEDVPIDQAKADMNTVWQPNETWRDLIFEVLEENNISPHCEGCDWTPSSTGT